MPIARRTMSALGNEIAPSIKAFIKANADAMVNDGTVDSGAEALGHAIAYGVAKALSSGSLSVAFTAGGVVPPSGNPAQGAMLHQQIQAVTTEP